MKMAIVNNLITCRFRRMQTFYLFETGTIVLLHLILARYCFCPKVGERQTVLRTEDSKDGAHFVGHNKSYDQVSERCKPTEEFSSSNENNL